ncbi:MAG: DNA repair protein RecN [Verrucomicrobia bacterium]|nr:MAG: DNA repair protein RecN [Verrucomicrobiota bacterium]
MSAMLVSLRIRNLALAEDVFWEPAPGFNTISGETGAGKSLILGALKLLLGDRAGRTYIRAGASHCTIEAEFQVNDSAHFNKILMEQGSEPCEETICLIRRILTCNGPSRNFLNGSPCTLSALKVLGRHLVDLHGPHDHQSLFSREEQGRLLDAFAGALEQRNQVTQSRQKFLRLLAEEDRLTRDQLSLEREIELLRHQVQEILSAQVIPGEEEELLLQQRIMTNAQRIAQISSQVEERLEQSVTVPLAAIFRLLKEWARLDPRAMVLLNLHAEISEKIDAWVREMRNLQPTEFDLQNFDRIQDRLDTLQILKRKYGSTLAEITAFANRTQVRLEELTHTKSRINQLKNLLKQAKEDMEQAAVELSQQRRLAGPKLAQAICHHLHELGFRQAGFFVELRPLPDIGTYGMEKPEFLFAPNPGEPSLPLHSIASSGEISRILLAIKSALVEQDEIPILVFDEIDTNIGGEIATQVGVKIRNIAKQKQVLCISHLPQVAALAATHFVVEKEMVGKRSCSTIREVRNKERVEELARMLGSKATSAMLHAQSLLELTVT